ncbi:MAG TPA: ATP-binding protein [Methylomirabilota bacterium]|nr:ATP-binding protein [Methylomirabilota bacterium]
MRLLVRHKLVLLSVLIIVGVSSAFLTLNLWLTSRWVEEDLQQRVVTFARVMAATISSRQEFESGATLQDQVRRIRAAREDLLQVDVLAFRATTTEVVASSHPERRLPFTRGDVREVLQGRVLSVPGDGEGGHYWEVMAPIRLDGVVAGALVARFSSRSVDRLARRLRTGGFLLTGVSVLAMGLLMSVAVRYVVDRPVQAFLRGIARIRDGDTGARVPVATADEFGLLASHFNAMVERIRRFSDELQMRVQEATGEVDRRYQEVRQLNMLLFDLQRRLTHAERLAVSGRIMAEVAHEVGTPLHSVAGHLELLRRDLPPGVLAPAMVRRLHIVETQVTRVIEIIARLLDLTRRPAAEPRPVDLNRLVRDMGDVVRPGVAAAGLSLEVISAPGLTAVAGDPDQLQQAVLNLLTNAIDATPTGGGITVITRGGLDQGEVELIVRDSGRGIPPADRDRVFEPFFSTKPPGHGTGLGLFITAQIVRDHKGRIELETEEGRGSSFRVFLPAVGSMA